MDHQTIIKTFLIIFISSFCLTWLLVPFMIKLSRKFNAIDLPDKRKVHKEPIGRLGGIAIYLGVMLSLIPAAIYFKLDVFPYVAGSMVIFITGVLDDIYDLKPITKLFGQILAALILLYLGVRVEVISGFEKGNFVDLGTLQFPLTLFWIVSITNMMNFLDGLDGLAAGVATITAFTLIFVNVCDKLSLISIIILTSLAGSSLGFLRYNWFPAKIFMGDTGAMFLGFSIGVASVLGAFKGATLAIVMVPFITLLLPIYDMFYTIIRRVSKNRPLFKPDKEHIHHQFLKMGFSHDRAVMLICVISIILGVSAVFITSIKSIYAAAVMLSLAIFLALCLTLFFKYGKKQDDEIQQ